MPINKINKTTNKGFFGRIRDMIRFYKKWWFLRELRKESKNHSKEHPVDFFLQNNKIIIERAAFLKQVSAQWMRMFYNFLWWSEKFDEEKMKEVMNDFNSIIDSCISEDHWLDVVLNPDGRPFIRTNPKSEDILGWSDLAQGLLSKYDSLWVKIFVPIITFIIGIVWSKKF